MERKIITTADGSTTIKIVDWDEQYHSKHGAVQEAYHVFIEHGLSIIKKPEVTILEMGFGTGLNAFITFLEAKRNQLKIHYTAIEAFPIAADELSKLNYVGVLDALDDAAVFSKMHACKWEKKCEISGDFNLLKYQKDIKEVALSTKYDLVYFDAFGPRVQPDLWTEAIFKKMFNALTTGGVLVTYSAKGSVRRALQNVGFTVERLPGPPGKREMLRAIKSGTGG